MCQLAAEDSSPPESALVPEGCMSPTEFESVAVILSLLQLTDSSMLFKVYMFLIGMACQMAAADFELTKSGVNARFDSDSGVAHLCWGTKLPFQISMVIRAL